MPRVVVIGAAGEMLTVTVQSLALNNNDVELVLADIDVNRLSALRLELSPLRRVDTEPVDLFDPTSLADLVQGADLVVHGAGPFYRTARPVMEACIAAGVDYLDLGDDIEAIDDAFLLDEAARKASVSLLVGCGASPGITNVVAAEMMATLTSPESVRVAWCVGDEGPQRLGGAVLEHLVHMVSGVTPTWENGQRGQHHAWQRTQYFDFGPPLGRAPAFECSHPEVVTLPHYFPTLTEARCYGAVRPRAANAMLGGVGEAVRRGALTHDDAMAFLGDVLSGGRGSVRGWRSTWQGLRDAQRRGLLTWRDVSSFLVNGLLGRQEPYQGGVACEVVGVRNGRRVRLRRSTARSGPGTAASSMAQVTGTAAAAFVQLALDGRRDRGTLAPEAWVDPQVFHGEMGRRGFVDYLGPVTEEHL